MKHIKLFEGFVNENKAMNEGFGVPDTLGLRRLGDTIANKLFPGYEEGRYDEDTNYMYGDTIKYSDGSTEKGYTTNRYTLKLTGKFLILNSLKFNKNAVSEFMSVIDQEKKHKYTTLDSVTILVRSVKGISSKKEELNDIVIWAGDHERGAYSYASIDFPQANFKDNSAILKELKSQLDERAKKATLTDILVILFSNVGALDMVPSKDLHRSAETKDWGYGSQASSNTFHDIKKAYDFSKFVKKHGKKPLEDAINRKEASFWKGRRFKGLSDDGFLATDESWVEKWD